jgi:pimeloyl-ACP methyl ester carboxylesterase
MHLPLYFQTHWVQIMACGNHKLLHSKAVQVVTYDTRGHGQSDVIAETTVQNLAEDVIDILDALTLKKHIFVGFQWADDCTVFGYSPCCAF